MTHTLFARDALLPSGWQKDVLLQWDTQGRLTEVRPASVAPKGVDHASGPVIPGLPNLHSHAFQRAFAGLTEYRAATADSFWSWRTLMYGFAQRLKPEQLEAIASWLYLEMLEAGYTTVCEFHYLHHDPQGRAYADDATLSLCLLRAAHKVGIGLTLLPVLYQSSGFGAAAPTAGQRRFIRSTDSMLRLLERLRPICAEQGARLGLAPHSLRAVPPDSLGEVLAGLRGMDASAPIHIHVAEQTAEVDACLAWSGQRPVEWLLDHAAVDSHWCLVHATHLSDDEYRRAAGSGAVAGLCPSTEANLGDGIFDLPRWLNHGGRWGLGSDSHITVNAAEEMLLLEYGQRLSRQQRNVLASASEAYVAAAMTLQAVQGGAQAAGRPVAGLAVGQQADFCTLDAGHVALAGLSPPQMLSAHVFASHRGSALQDCWVGGKRQVQEGRHGLHEATRRAFIAARQALLTGD